MCGLNTVEPWLVVYEYLHGRVKREDLVNKLYKLLSKPYGSPDYLLGLELLKAVKSQLPMDKLIEILKPLRELKEKLYNDTDPENIVNEYSRDYSVSMGLLTLLEIYPFIGLVDKLDKRIRELTIKAFHEIRGDRLWEFLRAVIHGPIASLPPTHMVKYLEFLSNLNLDRDMDLLKFKIDLLNMILEDYPVKVFVENPGLVERIGLTLDEIGKALLEDVDKEFIRGVYSDLTVLVSGVNKLCGVEGGVSVCKRIYEIAGDTIKKLYEEISRNKLYP